ncbi:(2Fe-2S)-binding protein [Kitasatospora purpeofusca]|uniref:(2Fe-2S)-binding protein n=1 Tax=Kitasatospora purpeofusca TaxID=67352 RepID=UPI002E0F9A30|nr:(2Fe-2S)-binding protein [Kitasatospora purpeofusca]WSR37927.1 (2Fe-2S)-binding protein [Kitasatospora purpeofusca]
MDVPPRTVSLTVNGRRIEVRVPDRRLLCDVLRHDLALTGTHVGCEQGDCGACTVLLGSLPIRSCLVLAAAADGAEVTTVEGLALPDGTPGPLQRAFEHHRVPQCGFCAPGLLVALTALLRERSVPTATEVAGAVRGHLCRCTGYHGIVEAVQEAARALPDTPPVLRAVPPRGVRSQCEAGR